jgi:hypothetical protein
MTKNETIFYVNAASEVGKIIDVRVVWCRRPFLKNGPYACISLRGRHENTNLVPFLIWLVHQKNDHLFFRIVIAPLSTVELCSRN